MKMILRWFGENDDTIPLWKIRQIPGITGVAGTLLDIPVGELWPPERITALKRAVNAAQLELEVIESVNVHEDIKLGLPSRERYIENYQETIRNLGQAGVKVICYNFMPVFDWLRTDLARKLPDGSEAFAYDEERIKNLDPVQLVENMTQDSRRFVLPGWEPGRLQELKKVLAAYKNIDEQKLFGHLQYFLEKVIPVCESADVKMAIHPDDPPWSLFGLPRIISSRAGLEKLVKLVDSPYNGLTLCSGSLGAHQGLDLPDLIRHFGSMGRIHFAHIRNIRHEGPGKFHETSHLSGDGSLDLFAIMKAYYDIGFTGYIRPDHGRMIWGEQSRPGYGLYDRALGVAYMNGLWEAIGKMKKSSSD